MNNNPLDLMRPLIYKTYTNTDYEGRVKLSRTLFGHLMSLSDSPGKYVDWKYQGLCANSDDLTIIASFMLLAGNPGEVEAIIANNKRVWTLHCTLLESMYIMFLKGTTLARVLSPLMLLLLILEPRSLKKTVMIYTLATINRIIYLPSERTVRFLQEPLNERI